MKKVYLKTLGCPKNEVDGDILQALLTLKGARFVDNPAQADIAIVNSCGFIDEAKEETIGHVLALARLKKSRNLKLVLAGCLAQRYKEELERELPEVDLVVGVADLSHAGDRILGIDSGSGSGTKLPVKYREYPVIAKSDKLPYAYLKISDGCDNCCTYCAIPMIRGPHRSRRLSRVVSEAETLVEHGARELILIGQDTTQYGLDLYDQRRLVQLLDKLEQLDGLIWMRLLYTHPAHYEQSLIDFLSKSRKVVPYLDLPLQHISDGILKRMNRKVTCRQIRKLLDTLRTEIDNLAIRTTYMIGFPGEREKDFRDLLDFQEEYKIERVGVFAYSREEGTRATAYRDSHRREIICERIDRMMTLVQEQSLERNRRLCGKKVEVLIDEKSKDGYYIARCYDQTPEIDGHVRVRGDVQPGRFYDVRITKCEAYDLEAAKWKR